MPSPPLLFKKEMGGRKFMEPLELICQITSWQDEIPEIAVAPMPLESPIQ